MASYRPVGNTSATRSPHFFFFFSDPATAAVDAHVEVGLGRVLLGQLVLPQHLGHAHEAQAGARERQADKGQGRPAAGLAKVATLAFCHSCPNCDAMVVD